VPDATVSGLVTVVHGVVNEPHEPLVRDVVWRSSRAEERSSPESGSVPLAVLIVTDPLVL